MFPVLDGIPLILKEQVYRLRVNLDYLLDKQIAAVVRGAYHSLQLVK